MIRSVMQRFQFYVCSACYCTAPAERLFPKELTETSTIEKRMAKGENGDLSMAVESITLEELRQLQKGLNRSVSSSVINSLFALISGDIRRYYGYVNSDNFSVAPV